MHKNTLYVVIFLVGLIAVAWIGAGYIGSNLPALAVTAVIGAFYVAGALELHRYRQATVTLMTATDDAAAALSDLSGWLQRLHHSLRNAVRLRVEGERVALPAPALTPYLVGLLVLLGMLGTLLGMMATLRGTGLALAGATDLEAIRGSLGAPVSGLAFAFGTSIAGVAASSMLGLLSALCRRERVHAVQQLDLQLAGTLRPYSHAHQREEAFRLLQQQTGLMPTLIERLDTLSANLQQLQQSSGERLSASQDEFHSRADAHHARLAANLEQSLKAGFEESARSIGAVLSPIMETTWDAALARQQELNEQLAASNQQAMASAAATYDERAAALIEAMGKAHDDSQAALESRDQQRLVQWSDALSAVTDSLENRWRESSEDAVNRQKDICDTLGRTAAQMAEHAQAQAQETIAEVARLMQTAAEAPRAAAEVIAELRQSISDSLVRDNAMLAERNQLLASLETLLDAANHASTEQRMSVDALVSTSADLLERVGTRFSEQIDAQTGTLGAAAAQVSVGAVEVASLAEVLGAVVEQFGSATDALGERLEQIEAALETSLARSDEQLAYYVAQAREVIDLSMLSQKQIIGELQQLAGTPGTPAHGKTPT